MNILVFTEGTVLIFKKGEQLSREERLEMSRQAGVQREENTLAFENNSTVPFTEEGSVYDFTSYVPIGKAVEKLQDWKNQGVTISYLTSRRTKGEIETIQHLLEKYNFPDNKNIFYRKQGEEYKDVAERVMPDILIEDDCASIGGEKEMTYPHIRQDLQKKIKSVIIPEFTGIDNLSDDITKL